MRSFIVMAIFLATSTTVAARDYTETRDLTIDASGLVTLIINAGAGSLDVEGVDGLGRVEVRATIVVPDASEANGKKTIEKSLVLTLGREGDVVELNSMFEQRLWGGGSNGRIDLEVRAPSSIAVTIEDGSGSMDVANFAGAVEIDDGSGSVDVRTVGSLKLEDGSGSIDISNVTGDVYVEDGSGSITVNTVGGTVSIDDGSGSIRVSDVAKDLIILDDGSGSVSFSDIRGTVEQEG